MGNIKLLTFLTAALLLALSLPAQAQINRDYQLANRLMQKNQYEKALPMLEELHQNNPDNFNYAKTLINCLIQLKQYERGIPVAESFSDQPNFSGEANIILGELYHYKGSTEKALEIWKANLDAHYKKLQVYVETARTMINRREYMEAVDVYKKARIDFNNESFFFGDIANAYMQAGEYELAIQEWLKLLEESPGQMSYIQRSLLRYNDPLLYDITIVELDERLDNLSTAEDEYETFFKLQIWLLQENKLFQRALSTAKTYENRSSSLNYSLFNLGRQLTDNNEFKLAEEAFSYYIEKSFGEIKWRSMEELANTYSKWAKYLEDYSLDYTNKKDSLYQLASVMLDSIETETSNYSRMGNVHIKQAEIALDHVFDLDEAEQSLEKLQNLPSMIESPELAYLEGRIQIAKKNYPQARIALTKANKLADIGGLAEKTRYFLALTDFYAGDYEFATIQLKSLGRQNTSYYANDALELRLWLQQGIAEDSTGSSLDRFADAVFKYNNGESAKSNDQFLDMIEDPAFRALKDDAMLFYVNTYDQNAREKLANLSQFLSENNYSPVKEKLMWKQANLAEQTGLSVLPGNCSSTENCFSSENPDETKNAHDIYEELIIQYPKGFYAPYARERLTELTNENS
ncbi:tetratricopeptide repeat protein [Gracilimonas mengyeensis]|uniref:Uncharacterized protein n=1 Tax=Gracilimonas mengyeensis TaxID=1302730 RepID=A0A521E0L0_9BACT|nr:tetratricopeptide repeat protein [Gracilimonas mengyeensis]SMO77494.1 hypothetical protein SAMN06265219_11028 [Gracilimonas mengyeensis]